MKRWHKIIIILLSSLILVIGILTLVLKSRLLPEVIEDMVISRLEALIKQPLSYSRLEIGLWGTITIKDISVGDTTQGDNAPLLHCPQALLHCQIFPLLSKKIVIEKVILHRPQINLGRDELGMVSFLGDRSSGEKIVVHEKESAAYSPDPPAVSFSVNQLTVEDGGLTLQGNSESSPQPLTTVLHQLDLTVHDFSLVSPFSLNLTTQVASNPPSRATLKAVVDPLAKEFTSNLEVQADSNPQCRALMEGAIVLKDRLVMIEKLRVLSGDSTISIEGTLQNFLSGPLTGQLHVTSPALVMDEIISCLEAIGNAEEMDQDDDQGKREMKQMVG